MDLHSFLLSRRSAQIISFESMCLTFDQVLAAIGAEPLLANLGQDTIMIADKAYDADRTSRRAAPPPTFQI